MHAHKERWAMVVFFLLCLTILFGCRATYQSARAADSVPPIVYDLLSSDMVSIVRTGTVPVATKTPVAAFGSNFTSYISGPYLRNINATNITAGTMDPARLGTGVTSSVTYLRGDNTWGAVASNVFCAAAGPGILITTNEGYYVIATSFSTNGLASTNYVATAISVFGNVLQGYVDRATSGLASTNYVNTATNDLNTYLMSAILSADNAVVHVLTDYMDGIVSGLASTNYVNIATNTLSTRLISRIVIATNDLNTVLRSVIGQSVSGMATTNYVNTATNTLGIDLRGYVNVAVANLATTNYVNTATNVLSGVLRTNTMHATNDLDTVLRLFIAQSLSGMASTNYVVVATNDLNTAWLARLQIATNTLDIGLRDYTDRSVSGLASTNYVVAATNDLNTSLRLYINQFTNLTSGDWTNDFATRQQLYTASNILNGTITRATNDLNTVLTNLVLVATNDLNTELVARIISATSGLLRPNDIAGMLTNGRSISTIFSNDVTVRVGSFTADHLHVAGGNLQISAIGSELSVELVDSPGIPLVTLGTGGFVGAGYGITNINPAHITNAPWLTAVDIGGLATTNWVDTGYYPRLSNPANYLTSVNLSGLATTNWVGDNYYPLLANPANYLTSVNLSGLATTNWVGDNYYPLLANPANYVTASSISGLATIDYVGAATNYLATHLNADGIVSGTVPLARLPTLYGTNIAERAVHILPVTSATIIDATIEHQVVSAATSYVVSGFSGLIEGKQHVVSVTVVNIGGSPIIVTHASSVHFPANGISTSAMTIPVGQEAIFSYWIRPGIRTNMVNIVIP